jgi:hypothetical protein
MHLFCYLLITKEKEIDKVFEGPWGSLSSDSVEEGLKPLPYRVLRSGLPFDLRSGW